MKLSLWDAKTLLILLAFGQGAALVYAGVALDGHTDGPLFWTALVRGILVGFSVSFAASYAGHSLPRIKHKTAGPAGWWAFGAQVAASIVVIGVCTVENPQGWLRWIVGPAYAVMTDGAVVAVAMASGKLFPEIEQAKEVAAQPKTTPKKKATKQRNHIDRPRLVLMLSANPRATNEQLAQPFGVSAEAVRKMKKTITPSEIGLAK